MGCRHNNRIVSNAAESSLTHKGAAKAATEFLHSFVIPHGSRLECSKEVVCLSNIFVNQAGLDYCASSVSLPFLIE